MWKIKAVLRPAEDNIGSVRRVVGIWHLLYKDELVKGFQAGVSGHKPQGGRFGLF